MLLFSVPGRVVGNPEVIPVYFRVGGHFGRNPEFSPGGSLSASVIFLHLISALYVRTEP